MNKFEKKPVNKLLSFMIKFYKHNLILILIFYKYNYMIAVSMTDLGFVVCLGFCRSVTLAIQGLFRCKDQNMVLNYEDDHPDEEREGDLQQRRRSKYS